LSQVRAAADGGSGKIPHPAGTKKARLSYWLVSCFVFRGFMNSTVLCSLVLMTVGMLLALGATIKVLINAWRVHFAWALVVFFVPFGEIVFVCMHWSKTKVSFILSFVGLVMAFGGIFAVPEVRDRFLNDLNAKMAVAGQTKAPDLAAQLTVQIQAHRDKLEALQGAFAQDGVELTKQYQQLDAQRKALKSNDADGITKFNAAAAAYQARNTARKQMQQQMDELQKELDGLLETRSRNASAAAAVRK
jgi:hypothetical protein